MKQAIWLNVLFIWAAGIGAMLLSSGTATAQTSTTNLNPPLYNPYPPGILPSDIASEEARIIREITGIENEAIQQWHALPPPVLTGQPPTLAGTGQQANQLLGKLMNFDLNMSPLKNRACSSCHMPYAAFSGPIQSVNLTMIAYPVICVSGGQAHGTEIHLCVLFPRAKLQPNPGPFLRRKFLGFPRHRISHRKSLRGTGATSPR